MPQQFISPAGGGIMGMAVRAHHWDGTTLGPMAQWPQALINALNLLLNSPESMYLVWGPELTFFFNDAYRPILGPRMEGALGQPLPVLWADAWHAVAPSLKLALDGQASRFVDVSITMNRYGAEEQTWWSYSYSPIYHGQEVAGVFCFTVETTERVLAQQGLQHIVDERTRRLEATEAALRQAQKMEAIGQITGGLAHDFNNLLAHIAGSLDLVKLHLQRGQTADLEKYVAVAHKATQRATALTTRLLAFSRRKSLLPVVADVNTLTAGMEDMIRQTMGPQIETRIDLAASAWPVFIDPPQLENALLNSCINARDAMPDGGSLVISTANVLLDRRAARRLDMDEGEYILLSVTDTGMGMTPEVITKAFEPFFTTKPVGHGTGLGLSMIYAFAQQSGGNARIASIVGSGTTIQIYLPRLLGDAAGFLPGRSKTPVPVA